MTTEQEKQEKQAAELKVAQRKTSAFEYGLEAGLADLGLTKEAFCEVLGVDPGEQFTGAAIEWGNKMEAQRQAALTAQQ